MRSNKKEVILPTKFKLISFYEEWDHSKSILLNLKSSSENENISLDDKFQKLSTIIQDFEKLNGNEDYNNKYLKNNCMNLKSAIKSYFKDKEQNFYRELLPFIIEQSLLIEERAKINMVNRLCL